MEVPNTLLYHILPKLPIPILRRIVALNHLLFLEVSTEFFWKRFVEVNILLRHDEVITESIRLRSESRSKLIDSPEQEGSTPARGGSPGSTPKPRPYFCYALLYRPDSNVMLCRNDFIKIDNIKGFMINEWSDLIEELSFDLDEPISKVYLHFDVLYTLTKNNNLYWWIGTDRPLGSDEGLSYREYYIVKHELRFRTRFINYSKIAKFTNIAKISTHPYMITKQLIYSLTTDGSIAKLWRYLPRPKLFPYPEKFVDLCVLRMIDSSIHYDVILLITANGRVLISDDKLQKFTELPFSTPILKGTMNSIYNVIYITLLSVDGSLIKGVLEVDRFVQKNITQLPFSSLQGFMHKEEYLNRYEL